MDGANNFAFLGEDDFVNEDFGDMVPCKDKSKVI